MRRDELKRQDEFIAKGLDDVSAWEMLKYNRWNMFAVVLGMGMILLGDLSNDATFGQVGLAGVVIGVVGGTTELLNLRVRELRKICMEIKERTEIKD